MLVLIDSGEGLLGPIILSSLSALPLKTSHVKLKSPGLQLSSSFFADSKSPWKACLCLLPLWRGLFSTCTWYGCPVFMTHKAAKVDCSPLLIDLYKWNTRIPECSSIIHAFINMEIYSRASPRNAALGVGGVTSLGTWGAALYPEHGAETSTPSCYTDSLLVCLTTGGSTVSPRNGHTQTLVWTLGVRWSKATTLDSGRPRTCPWCSDPRGVSRVCAASEFLGMICFIFPRSLYRQNPWWSPKRSVLSVLWNLFKSFTCCVVLGERF